MGLLLNLEEVKRFKSPSQKIRVLTESWVGNNIFCPSCGCCITAYSHNKPVADFCCSHCSEDFELKSKKDYIGEKVLDGAYKTMIARLQSRNNPNLFLLNYLAKEFIVNNFFLIPKHFFVPRIIERRKPLSDSARRAGWIGCNILLGGIPESGKIYYIKNQRLRSKDAIHTEWNRTLFLRESINYELRGWLLDIMNCIDHVGKKEFFLDELYAFEQQLIIKHPNNKHIRDKIRQQLQFLRDKGYLDFVSRGRYRIR